MEALLYSEVNIFSIIILLIIALETMILGYDKEFKNTLFIASVWCAAISNMLDFFWNLGKINILPVPVWTMWLINFFIFWLLDVQRFSGAFMPNQRMEIIFTEIN